MNLFDSALAALLPIVPKSIVGRVARKYVAGDTLAEDETAPNPTSETVTTALLCPPRGLNSAWSRSPSTTNCPTEN